MVAAAVKAYLDEKKVGAVLPKSESEGDMITCQWCHDKFVEEDVYRCDGPFHAVFCQWCCDENEELLKPRYRILHEVPSDEGKPLFETLEGWCCVACREQLDRTPPPAPEPAGGAMLETKEQESGTASAGGSARMLGTVTRAGKELSRSRSARRTR